MLDFYELSRALESRTCSLNATNDKLYDTYKASEIPDLKKKMEETAPQFCFHLDAIRKHERDVGEYMSALKAYIGHFMNIDLVINKRV